MNELDLHYPPDSCPFCNIATAFPAPTLYPSLASCIPEDKASDPERTSPSSFIVLASEDVIAFLDILPMTRGHLLVATRGHKVKVQDMDSKEGQSIGKQSDEESDELERASEGAQEV